MVEDIATLAEGVRGVTLRSVDGSPLPPWEPGAHVDLVLEPAGGTQQALVRQYSLCGDPADRTRWRIAVLREPASRGGSAHVHETLAPGDRVQVRGPRNHFALVDAPGLLFVAGGIGITPILPMLAAAEAAGTRWRLLYGGRRLDSMAFLDELACYGTAVEVRPEDEYGLLDLASFLRPARHDGTAVYCCGPEPLLAAVQEHCADWPAGSLHLERFHAVAADPAAPPAGEFEVELRQSGLTVRVKADRSVLESIEDAGVYGVNSCREGTCGSCETPVLEGVVDHRDSLLTDEERAAGDTMMICVSRARTPRLVLDL
ncbi:PDR/VanB family oxidoreductase [Streptomyces sp. NPDC047042]|uniref:PDR/VanB family oxidoreductase n=1 Tax=Streptomyces sp. NPDC047042 TaxID=3154807 RepID=UPI0033D7880B